MQCSRVVPGWQAASRQGKRFEDCRSSSVNIVPPMLDALFPSLSVLPRVHTLCTQSPSGRTSDGQGVALAHKKATTHRQRGQKRGGAPSRAVVSRVVPRQRWASPAHRTPGAHTVEAASTRPHTVALWCEPPQANGALGALSAEVASVLWLLPNATGAGTLGRMDMSETPDVSLAIVAQRAEPFSGTAPARNCQVSDGSRRRAPMGYGRMTHHPAVQQAQRNVYVDVLRLPRLVTAL